MTLVEILWEECVNWPAKARSAYQSAVDTEIYFKDMYGEIFHRQFSKEKAEVRGVDGSVDRSEFAAYSRIRGMVQDKNSKDENWLINRITLGLKEDFDINSPELARLMYDKGWRK